MSAWRDLAMGLNQASSAHHLLCAGAGALLGAASGLLPGLGPAVLIALLLPLLPALDVTGAMILLGAAACGAHSGASVASVLTRPGPVARAGSSAMEGYSMARQGRAALALLGCALACLVGGALATAFVLVALRPLTQWVGGFGPQELFALMVLTLTTTVVLSHGSLVKALAMALCGWLLAGVSPQAYPGLAHGLGAGMPDLSAPVGLQVLAVGLFGLGQVVIALAQPDAPRDVWALRSRRRLPHWRELRRGWAAIARGAALGIMSGVVPAGSSHRSMRVAYGVEQRIALQPEEVLFGRGNLRGVVGPESARGAGLRTAFLPLLALGLPVDTCTALILVAMTALGLSPGVGLITDHPALVWGVGCSQWITGAMLVLLALPVPILWAQVLRVPRQWVLAAAVLAGCVGVYLLRRDPADLYIAAAFAALAYGLHLLHCDPTPLLVGCVVGPRMEAHARRTVELAAGDWSTLLTRPLSAVLLACAVAAVLAAWTLPGLALRWRADPEDD